MFSSFVMNLNRLYYYLGYKPLNIDSLVKERIEVKSSEIEYFPLSLNSIIIVKYNGEKLYFRECLRHVGFRDYIVKQITLFYDIASKNVSIDNFNQKIPIKTVFNKDEISEFKVFIERLFDSEPFWRGMESLNKIFKIEGFNIWTGSRRLSTSGMKKLGITELPESISDIFLYFLVYISSMTFSYRFHYFVNKGDYETYFASRTMSYWTLTNFFDGFPPPRPSEKTLAEISDCKEPEYKSKFSPYARIARITIDGSEHIGVLCDRAEGVRALDADYKITPQLQHSLSSLNLLDAISYQDDHFCNNYNISNVRGHVSVCAFDNDAPRAFGVIPTTPHKFARGGSSVIKNGFYNRPYLDRNLCEYLLNANLDDLIATLRIYLNRLQLWSLKIRIIQLRRAISKSLKDHRLVLLDDNEWSDETVRKELSGDYGDTYLVQYSKKQILNKEFNG